MAHGFLPSQPQTNPVTVTSTSAHGALITEMEFVLTKPKQSQAYSLAEPFLTPERMERIARLQPTARREAMAAAAREEWERCSEDIFYWLTPAAHIVPYVYTKDPKPLHRCKHCPESSDPLTFSKRHLHLLNTHNLEVPDEKSLRAHYDELDTIRPFTMKEYFPPIIETWLREDLMAIEKSRDMMMTWLVVIMFAWDTLFHRGRQNLFQSETAAKTRELVHERAWIIYDSQPKWLKAVHKATYAEGSARAGLIEVPSLKGSQIVGFPQGPDKVRMYHPTGFFSDEAAFNPEASATFAAIRPAIMSGGKYTAISSANEGWFHRLCLDQLNQGSL